MKKCVSFLCFLSLFVSLGALAKPVKCKKKNLGKACLISYINGTSAHGICMKIDDSPSCEIPESCGKNTLGQQCIIDFVDNTFEVGTCTKVDDQPSCELLSK